MLGRRFGLDGLIREIDLSDQNGIYLKMTDGFSVSMGTRQDIHAKLRSLILTRRELIERGMSGGSIDVSKPETPTYVPSLAM